jgi:hypothetical protein
LCTSIIKPVWVVETNIPTAWMSGLKMTYEIQKMWSLIGMSHPHTSVSWMCVLYNHHCPSHHHHLCVLACMHAHTTEANINYVTSYNLHHKIHPFKDIVQCCNRYCRTQNILHNLSLLPPPVTSIYKKTDKIFWLMHSSLLFFLYTYIYNGTCIIHLLCQLYHKKISLKVHG